MTARPRGWNRFNLEVLEDRTTPAFVDVGLLRLDSNSATFDGSTFTGGIVQVGFKPLTDTDTFVGLAAFELTGTGTTGKVTVDNGATPGFTVDDASLSIISTLNTALPIWETSDPVAFEAQTLTTNFGQDISASGKGISFARFGSQVKISALLLVDGGTGKSTDNYTGLQGTLEFAQIPELSVKVNDFNYIYAKPAGVTLTGAEVALGGKIDRGGVTIANAGLTLAYAHTAAGQDVFSIGGQFTLESSDGNLKTVSGSGAELDVVLTDGDITRVAGKLNVAISAAKFQLSGTNVTFSGGFGAEAGDFRLDGTVTMAITPDPNDPSKGFTLAGFFGSSQQPDEPGILLKNGQLEDINIYATATFNYGDVTFDISKVDPFFFEYDKSRGLIEASGAATLTFGSKTQTAITVDLPANDTDAGLIIQDGKLIRLAVSVEARFGAGSVTLNKGKSGDLLVAYDVTGGSRTYSISGSASLENIFHAEVQLGTPDQPGIQIVNGDFHLENFAIEIQNVPLGAITIREGSVAYSADGADIAVAVSIEFPGGWELDGEVKFNSGVIDFVALAYNAGTSSGRAIGDTGLFLNYADITVANIDNPDLPVTVSGDVAVTFGPSVTLAGGQGYITAAQGKIVVNDQRVSILGGVYFGAFNRNPDPNNLNPPVFAGFLGSGTGHFDLDWAANIYSADVDFQLLDGLFQVTAGFTYNGTPGNTFLVIDGKAEIEIPSFVPVVGGLTLAEAAFFLDYRDSGGVRSGFFAGWAEVLDGLFEGGVKYDFTSGMWSVIGREGIEAAMDCEMDPASCLTGSGPFTYTNSFTVPVGTTGLIVSLDLPEIAGSQSYQLTLPSGVVVPQSQFAARGITFSSVVGHPDQKKIIITGGTGAFDLLAAGVYGVEVVSTAKFNGGIDFTSGATYPSPVATAPSAQNDASNGNLINLSLAGSVNKKFINQVSHRIFVQSATQAGARPVLTTPTNVVFTPGSVDPNTNQQTFTLTATVDISDRIFDTYVFFAKVDDGVNLPITTSLSATPVTSNAPINGQIINALLNSDVDGLTVYVDANANGQFDQGTDPSGITNRNGGYTIVNTNNVLVSGQQYDLRLLAVTGVTVNAKSGTSNPERFTFGTATQSFDYLVDVAAGVNGVVFLDNGQNGKAAGNPGAGGVQVFVDLNNNGKLDPTDPQTLSAPDGTFHIYGLNLNTPYTLRINAVAPYYSTSPMVQMATLTQANQQLQGLSFGVLTLQRIDGTVMVHEVDDSGNLNPTAVPQAGAKIVLTKAGDSFTAQTTSNSNGYYSFTVPYGDYTVSQELHATAYRELSPFSAVLNVPNSGVSTSLGFVPIDVAAGDIDGDGFIDLAVTHQGYDNPDFVRIYWGNGQPGFNPSDYTELSQTGEAIALADTQGSGHLDVLTWIDGGNQSSIIRHAFVSRTNFFRADIFEPGLQSTGQNLSVGDLNGDGVEDLAYAYSNNALMTYTFVKGGGFGGQNFYTTAGNYAPNINSVDSLVSINVANLRNGTINDVVVSAGGLTYGQNNGNAALTLSNPSFPESAFYAFGDIDSDGIDDIFYFDRGLFQLVIQHGNGDGTFSTVPGFGAISLVSPQVTTMQLFLVDINGDRRPEAIAYEQAPGANTFSIFPNSGSNGYFNGNIRVILGFSEGTMGGAAAIADVNNDGLADLIDVDTNTNTAYVYLNRSTINNGTITRSLTPGTAQLSANFVNAQLGSVSGAIFDDVNRNGVRDAEDQGLAGVSVYLDLNNNNRYDRGIDQVTKTVTGGAYAFGSQLPGTYSVGVVTWESNIEPRTTTPITVTAGTQTMPDFLLPRRWLKPAVSQIATLGQELRAVLTPTGQSADPLLKYELVSGPAGATIDSITGALVWTPSALGDAMFTVRYSNARTALASETLTFTIPVFAPVTTEVPTPPTTPAFNQYTPADRATLILTATASSDGWVRVFDTTHGVERFRFMPYGGLEARVAIADVTGDGVPDIITVAGPGGGPHVKVFDGSDGSLLRSEFVYAPEFLGGLFVAAGDLDGDGTLEIVVTPDSGGGPVVSILDPLTLQVVSSVFVLESEFRGGLRTAVGDLNGDGVDEVIVAAGVGGGPRVAVLDGAALKQGTSLRLRGDFFAFDSAFRGGAFLAAADIDGDGIDDLAISAGIGGGPRVDIIDGKTLLVSPLAATSFFAGDPTSRGGTTIGLRDLNGDGRAELLASEGLQTQQKVTIWDPRTSIRIDEFLVDAEPTLWGVALA